MYGIPNGAETRWLFLRCTRLFWRPGVESSLWLLQACMDIQIASAFVVGLGLGIAW